MELPKFPIIAKKMRPIADVKSYFRGSAIPVTMGLLFGIIGGALFFFLIRINPEIFRVSGNSLAKPWAFVTYPFTEPLGSGLGIIFLLFLGFWLFWIGGAMERDMGSARLACFWVISSIVCALFIVLGGLVTGLENQAAAYGCLLPISALTIVWGVRNKRACIRLWCILPVTGIIIAFLSLGTVLVEYGMENPLLGIFAIMPLGLAWLYGEDKLPYINYRTRQTTVAYKPSKAQVAKENAFFEDVRRREKERDERERLRKLFEGSLDENDPR